MKIKLDYLILKRLKDERVASVTLTAADHVNNVNNDFEGYLNLEILFSYLKFYPCYQSLQKSTRLL